MNRPSDSLAARVSCAASLLVPLLGALPAAQAATFSVSNLGDSGAGSLRAAITSANARAGADIVDASSLNGTINLLSPLPLLQSTISISGAGSNQLTVRRGNNATFRVFSVAANASAKLSGLTLSNGGGALETGGAIMNSGTLSLSGCTLSGNSARRGGALFSTGTVSIEGSTFARNFADGGAAISSSNGFLTVSNSTFNSNTSFGDGGALVLLQTRATLTQSTFSYNAAGNTGNGGAIFSSGRFDLSRAGLTVQNCTLVSNRAARGGAIWNSGELLQVQNATITDNIAPSGAGIWSVGDAFTLSSLSGSILAGNNSSSSVVGNDAVFGTGKNTFVSRGYNLVGGGSGRAAFNKSGDKTGLSRDALLIGTLIPNGGPTQTLAPLPGSPAIDAIPTSSLAVPVDQRGTARPQGAAGDIGAVELVAATNQPQTGSTIVVNNSADTDDGVCTTDNCSLREAINTANNRVGTDLAEKTIITFDPKVFSTPQTIYVDQTPDYNSFFSTALVVSGYMKIVGPGANLLTIAAAGDVRQMLIQSSGYATISGVTFSGGRPYGSRGGAINNEGVLGLSNCTFSGNTGANGAGGAISSTGALSVVSCVFTDNSEHNNGFDTLNIHGFYGGGAIYNEGTLSVKDSTISNNTDNTYIVSPAGGGGIFNAGTATIENSTIANNSSNSQGGGICTRSPGTLTVLNCTISGNFTQNYSGGDGGGIYADSPLVLRNSTVSGNAAQSSFQSIRSARPKSVSFGDSVGGGVRTGATASIENCTITGNNSDAGSGLYVYDGTTTVKNTVIAANENNTVVPEVDRRYDSGATIVSGGYNFVGFSLGDFMATGDQAGGYITPGSPSLTVLDPRLGTLANNGGSVQTIAPLSGSPLINAGNPSFNASTLPFDERGPGFPRVVGGRIDIGAFETQRATALARPKVARPSAGSS